MKKFAFLILSIFATLSLSAQVTTSNISGKVTDVNGKALVGATVVATHAPSGTQYGAVVDIDGNYRLLNVRAGGPYTVQFQMLGYQTVEQQGLQAALADNLVLDATLKEESIGMDAVVVAVDGVNGGVFHQHTVLIADLCFSEGSLRCGLLCCLCGFGCIFLGTFLDFRQGIKFFLLLFTFQNITAYKKGTDTKYQQKEDNGQRIYKFLHG